MKNIKDKWLIKDVTHSWDNGFIMDGGFRWKWQAELWLRFALMIGLKGYYEIIRNKDYKNYKDGLNN